MPDSVLKYLGVTPRMYAKTFTIAPDPAINAYGAPGVVIPPASVWFPTYFALTSQGIGAETLTVRSQGAMSDGTFTGSTSTFTTNTTNNNPLGNMYGLFGLANGNTGQEYIGGTLDHIYFDMKSSIAASTATVLIRIFAVML